MKTIFLAFLLFINVNTFAQKYDCGWYGKKTVAERNTMFPFNKAKKVMLISYPSYVGMSGAGETKIEGTINIRKIKIGDFNKTYLTQEEVVLDKASVDQLSNILVNYTLKKKPKEKFVVDVPSCYTPRNSILFFDENDALIACLEICFECHKYGLTPDPGHLEAYNDISECRERLTEIKDIFIKNGIKYGVEEGGEN